MLYYHKMLPRKLATISTRWLRALTAFALSGYVTTVVAMEVIGSPPGVQPQDVFAAAVLCLSLAAAVIVLGSDTHAAFGRGLDELDERETALRYRIQSLSYLVFTGIVLASICYGFLAAKTGWWLPNTEKHWLALLWAFIMVASLLPTALLTWTSSEDGLDDEH
jgi:hypothetical protein